MPIAGHSAKLAASLKRNAAYLFIVIAAVAVISRITFAASMRHPGHGDPSYYYSLAENIYSGRGPVIDYIWNYMGKPEGITRASIGYWKPLTSVIICVSFFIFGKSLFSALIPAILAGLIISLITFRIAMLYSKSRIVAYVSACMILFIPSLFTFSLSTETPIHCALMASASFLFMIKGQKRAVYFLLSAFFAALAHLTRQDGILVFFTLLVVIAARPMKFKEKTAWSSAALLVYLLVFTPLLIYAHKVSEPVFSSRALKTLFITCHEDVYSFSKELSLRTYLEWGIGNIIASRVKAAVHCINTLYNVLGGFLWTFAVIGLFDVFMLRSSRPGNAKYLPPLLFMSLLMAVYILVIPVFGQHSAPFKCIIAVTPFLVVISIDALFRHVPSKKAFLLITAILGLFIYSRSMCSASDAVIYNNRQGYILSQLEKVLRQEHGKDPGSEIIIMTRHPWEVYHATKFRAIQIPNDGIDTIYEVARRYGANYLLLPAPRQALYDIYLGNQHDKRFKYIKRIPESKLKLFQII